MDILLLRQIPGCPLCPQRLRPVNSTSLRAILTHAWIDLSHGVRIDHTADKRSVLPSDKLWDPPRAVLHLLYTQQRRRNSSRVVGHGLRWARLLESSRSRSGYRCGAKPSEVENDLANCVPSRHQHACGPALAKKLNRKQRAVVGRFGCYVTPIGLSHFYLDGFLRRGPRAANDQN